MPTLPRPTKFGVIFFALTILSLLPLFIVETLPLQDYPQHLFIARALIEADNPDFGTQPWIEPHWRPVPYVTFYGFAWALGQFVSVETAGRVFLGIYMILLPLGLLSLLNAINPVLR